MKTIALTTLLLLCGSLNSWSQQQKARFSKVEFPVFSKEGHRGGRGLMPENTVPAMKHAIDLGMTTLEMDTHITKDNQVVVTHDDYLSPAFMLAPDGSEIPESDAKKYAVYQMDYTQLKKFDLGTKYYGAFPKQQKVKSYIPLLAELIDSVQHYLKKTGKKQVFYNIETKCSPQGDGVLNPDPEQFVSLLMGVLKQKGILPYVVIQSFDARTLQVLHKKYPEVRTSYLVANKKTFEENITDLGFNPFILSPYYLMVNEGLVKKCHDAGIKVLPWTVNTKAEIDALKALQVDGIISDYPDLLAD